MCTVCHKVYGRYNSVSYHVTIYHRNSPIKCDEKGCPFRTREARYIHFHKYYRHHIPLPDNIDLGFFLHYKIIGNFSLAYIFSTFFPLLFVCLTNKFENFVRFTEMSILSSRIKKSCNARKAYKSTCTGCRSRRFSCCWNIAGAFFTIFSSSIQFSMFKMYLQVVIFERIFLLRKISFVDK